MKWYKRDPDAALVGMIGLSLEERGVYNTVIDILYSRNGNVPNDDGFFARACECRPQVWRRVRDSLLAKGKFHYRADGKLTANRVETALKEAANWQQTQNTKASLRWKDKQNQSPVDANIQPQPQPQPDLSKKESKRERVARKRAPSPKTRLPENWTPKEGVGEQDHSEIERMRDWAKANGILRADWDAQWRNWKRKGEEFEARRSSYRGPIQDQSDKSVTAAIFRSMARRQNSLNILSLPARRLPSPRDVSGAGEDESSPLPERYCGIRD